MLLDVFQRLVDAGHSLLVIEHNLDVIKSADHVIDLGPGGGSGGGELVAAGTPEEVAADPQSHTGRYSGGPALPWRRWQAAAGSRIRAGRYRFAGSGAFRSAVTDHSSAAANTT